jgi:hypothetical protein
MPPTKSLDSSPGSPKSRRSAGDTNTNSSTPSPAAPLTTAQVRTLVAELRNITAVLADADPADKAGLYGELGVGLQYHQDCTVTVEAIPRGVVVGVRRGDLYPNPTRAYCRRVPSCGPNA